MSISERTRDGETERLNGGASNIRIHSQRNVNLLCCMIANANVWKRTCTYYIGIPFYFLFSIFYFYFFWIYWKLLFCCFYYSIHIHTGFIFICGMGVRKILSACQQRWHREFQIFLSFLPRVFISLVSTFILGSPHPFGTKIKWWYKFKRKFNHISKYFQETKLCMLICPITINIYALFFESFYQASFL